MATSDGEGWDCGGRYEREKLVKGLTKGRWRGKTQDVLA